MSVSILNIKHTHICLEAAIRLAGGLGADKMKSHVGVVSELTAVLANRRGEATASANQIGNSNERFAARAKLMKTKRRQKFA